jgi:hypothetical protein
MEMWGTKQTSGITPSVLKECCNLLLFFFSKFDENCRIIELQMIKIHVFFWPDSKYKLFQPFTLFSTSLLCFPLELIFKNQTVIETQSSRWRGGELGVALAHPLPPRHGVQLLLPELRASISSRQDNSLNKDSWMLVGCCELGTQ